MSANNKSQQRQICWKIYQPREGRQELKARSHILQEHQSWLRNKQKQIAGRGTVSSDIPFIFHFSLKSTYVTPIFLNSNHQIQGFLKKNGWFTVRVSRCFRCIAQDCHLLGYDAASADPGNYRALKMRALRYLGKSALEYQLKQGEEVGTTFRQLLKNGSAVPLNVSANDINLRYILKLSVV